MYSVIQDVRDTRWWLEFTVPMGIKQIPRLPLPSFTHISFRVKFEDERPVQQAARMLGLEVEAQKTRWFWFNRQSGAKKNHPLAEELKKCMLIRKITVGRDDVRLVRCRQFANRSQPAQFNLLLSLWEAKTWWKHLREINKQKLLEIVSVPWLVSVAASPMAHVWPCLRIGILNLRLCQHAFVHICVFMWRPASYSSSRGGVSNDSLLASFFLPKWLIAQRVKSKFHSQWIGFPISIDFYTIQ